MRIALFSDVHANLPALQSCLENIDSQKVDAVYCLGDLVGYNIWPNEVINEIRKRGIQSQGIMILVLEEKVTIVAVHIKKTMKKRWVRFLFHLQT